MNTEHITLYIPARNAAATLPACIEAVRAQTRPADEFFILLDPRSSDATAAAARASGVRIIEQTGATLGAARNQAVLAAAHRWVACCDSDVIIRPDWLERLAVRRGDAAGIGGRTLERVRNPYDAWRALHMPHHWGAHSFRNPFMLVSEVLFDREALLDVGGYRDDLNYYEDSDLCQRLREGGFDLLYEPAAAAEHQRSDTLISLLTLRWKYSEYRQRHLLDRFSGVLEKLRVNREYALNTLSRSLARGREELSYISFLLFFHHLLMDLTSLLSRRPLICGPHRSAYLRQLLNAARDAATEWSGILAGQMERDLSGLCREVAGDPAFKPGSAWREHLARVSSGVREFCGTLSGSLMGFLEASAEHCHGAIPGDAVPRLVRPDMGDLQRRLDSMPIIALRVESLMREVEQLWPDASGMRLLGRCCPSEREAPGAGAVAGRIAAGVPERLPPRGEGSPAGSVLVIPHLECHTAPLEVIREVPPEATRLVVCYQAPTQFMPGLDAITPADLASAAAEAGWSIERFDTLVGRMTVMLARSTLRGRRTSSGPLHVGAQRN